MNPISPFFLFTFACFLQANFTSCNSKREQSLQSQLVVETQVKQVSEKSIVEFTIGTPIYWGEYNTYVERGDTPIEIGSGVFDGLELTAFKIGDITKYKVELSGVVDPGKKYRMTVTDKKGEIFQAEIYLNQRQHLLSLKEK